MQAGKAMEEGGGGTRSSSISSYTNFGSDTAGPLTPPTLPFGFGRAAFGQQSAPRSVSQPQSPLSEIRNRPPARGLTSYRPRSPDIQLGQASYRPRSDIQLGQAFRPRSPGNQLGQAFRPRSPDNQLGQAFRPRSPNNQLEPIIDYTPLSRLTPKSQVLNVDRLAGNDNHLGRASYQSQDDPIVDYVPLSRPAPKSQFLNADRPSVMQRLNAPVIPKPQRANTAKGPIKRVPSPPLPFTSPEEQQKEDEARARRLERFKAEPYPEERIEPKKSKPVIVQQIENPSSPMDLEDEWATAEPVFGLCPDMCPENERSERERKGDLDRYERLDGERNQTSVNLAVKKYTRTPERDANLIRPLPVLKATMDYLLGLLDKPYSTDELLSLYNFLWDRMRAIRMDLRMQHIFNHEAVIMHEQMIRLHVLVMHELCEFSKAEGFIEGFDAHLNIEQMNKTFSELFQMYDDHRRKGEPLSTEPEFRGYYTLLKLDTHPGFAVEPSDLSVELASMSPPMGNSDDLIFARKVARAYRLPNYIQFFRLAGKATYLQACLMHAQFSKVRTQALASLYSGLRVSQGIPLAQVVVWLGMERQEVGELLSYHGFSIKVFEEPYVVKETEFLNREQYFPTRRSKLVESKRSANIINDIVAQNKESAQVDWLKFTSSLPAQREITEHIPVSNIVSAPDVSNETVEEEMPDYEDMQISPSVQESPHFPDKSLKAEPATPQFPIAPAREIFMQTIPDEKDDEVSVENWVSPALDRDVNVQERTSTGKRARPDDSEEQQLIEHSPKRQEITNNGELATLEAARDLERQRLEKEQQWLEESNFGRAKLWFRRWKRKTDTKVEAARVRKLEAEAALRSLTLGLPVQSIISQYSLRNLTQPVDLEHLRIQRILLLHRMWSHLEISDLAAPILREKNPDAKSIFWKLVFYADNRKSSAAQWLSTKLLGYSETTTYISKNVAENGPDCYCVVSEVSSGQSMDGTDAVLFLVEDDTPLSWTRSKLHTLVDTLPYKASAPLLIFTSLHKVRLQDELVSGLELDGLHTEKISSWRICSVTGKCLKGFYSDEALAEGIEWLAKLSPPQPEVFEVDLRDLVSEHLEEMKVSGGKLELGPADLINGFNIAIERSVAEILEAARSNPRHWPPPEIESFDEELYGVPHIGWNSMESLKPVLDTLDLCRLPQFPLPSTLQMQRHELLESVRMEYNSLLTAMENYMKSLGDFAPLYTMHAAQSILDRSVSLSWSEEGCKLVTDWWRALRSVFHTRLMCLNNEQPLKVYISRKLESKRFFEDKLDDYETSIRVATRLAHLDHSETKLDIPDRIKQEVLSYIEGQDVEDLESLNIMQEPEVDKEAELLIKQELEIIKSGEEQQLMKIVKSSLKEQIVLPATEAEANLEMLVKELNDKLDANTIAVLGADRNESLNPRLFYMANHSTPQNISDSTAVIITDLMDGSGSETDISLASSPYKSCAQSYKTFEELLECCERAQVSINGKLQQYFGV